MEAIERERDHWMAFIDSFLTLKLFVVLMDIFSMLIFYYKTIN